MPKIRRSFAGACLLGLGLAIAQGDAAEARPFRGSVPFSVLLCKSKDAGAPPHDVAYYQKMFLTPGSGGLSDYWHDVSYQNLDLAGSVVNGWFTVPKTTAEWQALDRGAKQQVCADAAAADPAHVTVPGGNRRIIVTFPGIDFFGGGGGAFVDINVDVGGIAHEGGHTLGLNHSFSDDPEYRNIWWAATGEYGNPWDAMSWANAFRAPTPFGDSAPWMITYNLDRMGWLPRSRVATFGADGVKRKTIQLAALSHPEVGGPLLVRIPFDTGDAMHYYAVEFRRKDRWDVGIPTDTILIHEIKKYFSPHGDYAGHYAFLMFDLAAPGQPPLQTFNDNGISIHLDKIDAAANKATVTIYSSYPDRCLPGFVWREARTYDHTCVPPASRTALRDEDNQAGSRVSSTGGAFGPDTCKSGFVWREAIIPSASLGDPPDHVCVPPASRTREADNNRQAAERKNPARISYGPNTCKPGFVWREGDDFDWVCVSPDTRTATRTDNSQAASRRNPGGGPFGPDTCKQGFVWRDAFPKDHVCVPVATRSQAAEDNKHAEERLLEN